MDNVKSKLNWKKIKAHDLLNSYQLLLFSHTAQDNTQVHVLRREKTETAVRLIRDARSIHKRNDLVQLHNGILTVLPEYELPHNITNLSALGNEEHGSPLRQVKSVRRVERRRTVLMGESLGVIEVAI